MTYTPITTRNLTYMKKQQAAGWSLKRIAAHWSRTPEEIDLLFWCALGRPKPNAVAMHNRRMARRVADGAIPDFGRRVA